MQTRKEICALYGLQSPAEWIAPEFLNWLDNVSGLRDYQADAVIAEILYHEYSAEPCVIVAATGAGKSHIIAGLAAYHESAMVLQPDANLVKQNSAKARHAELNVSIYSAGAGQKDMSGAVIFATPLTLKNVSDDQLPHVGVLIVDEAHKSTAATFVLAERLQKVNPDMVIVALTATPHRLGEGWIYTRKPDGSTWPEDQCRQPYYDQCVYDIPAPFLIERGYLVPVVISTPPMSYDTSNLELKGGKYTAESLEQTADVKTTAAICSFLATQERSMMVFCSSVLHAEQALTFLQAAGMLADVVTADTPQARRDSLLEQLREGTIQALVNVAVLTTGVDVPRVSLIAVLRPTESVSLYHQIVGRGMRMFDGKDCCELYDFTNNIENFFPDGDIFQPEIMSIAEKGAGEYLQCACPSCSHTNTYKAVPNKEKLPVDKQGYFLDLSGKRIRDEDRDIPAHYGRRCQGINSAGIRCDFFYLGKKCKHCSCENDIAARKCRECKKPLINWDKHLKEAAKPSVFWRTKGGSLAARYLTHVISHSMDGTWSRADFTVAGRATPLGYFLSRMDLRRFDDGFIPFAIEWYHTGGKYPRVHIFWDEQQLKRALK